MQPLVFVFGWPFGGAMNLARAVEYPVQTGRALGILFKWLFPLTGFIASESGIYCRILIAVAANAALLLISMCPATFVLGIRITRVFDKLLLRASQLSSPAQKRVMSV